MDEIDSTTSVIANNPILSGIQNAVVVYRITTDLSNFIIVDLNEIAENIEKVSKTAIVGKTITEVFPGVIEFGIYDTIYKVWKSGSPEHIDMKEYKDDRIIGWRENDIVKLESGDVVAIYTDKTDQKQKEMDLFYIGYHDKLTGLYNRAFFEEEMKRLDVPREYPISFIISDINGLKLANDAFGHKFGDDLLKNFATILYSCFRKEDIIARWGGDEFVVLLPKTSNAVALGICDRVTRMTEKVKVGHLNLSVAIGCAAKDVETQDFNNIISSAEDQMYQNKLLNSKSARSETVFSLVKTLYEMNYETEEHAKRLLKIVSQVGRKLNLMPQEIEELRLLAILHDIGKLGVPTEIIMKPSGLTPEEWIEIKKHSEIGYRIAQSTPGLAHISKYILSVHERWDGQGYPQHLRGNATPKLSRIIAIVDAYDTMISGRPYKAPMTPVQAKNEIIQCSGSQFDPLLVDLFVKLKIGRKQSSV